MEGSGASRLQGGPPEAGAWSPPRSAADRGEAAGAGACTPRGAAGWTPSRVARNRRNRRLRRAGRGGGRPGGPAGLGGHRRGPGGDPGGGGARHAPGRAPGAGGGPRHAVADGRRVGGGRPGGRLPGPVGSRAPRAGGQHDQGHDRLRGPARPPAGHRGERPRPHHQPHRRRRTSQTDLDTTQASVEIQAGEVLTERQALDGMLVHSANDLAYTLACWDAGSVPAFVAKMNATAASLGMHPDPLRRRQRLHTALDVDGGRPAEGDGGGHGLPGLRPGRRPCPR